MMVLLTILNSLVSYVVPSSHPLPGLTTSDSTVKAKKVGNFLKFFSVSARSV